MYSASLFMISVLVDYTLDDCIAGMHISIHWTIGGISQYTRLLYWRDAPHNTLAYCIGEMNLTIQYNCCIGGMHLIIH